MTKPNNYLKVLQYLKQYDGDGQLYSIEDVLDIDQQQKQTIFNELARHGLIKLEGGQDPGSISFVGGGTFNFDYIPAKALITFEGSKYIKEELQMDNNKVNIQVKGNSTANVILNSPGAIINNKPQIIEKVERIKEVIANDISIDDATRSDALVTLNNLVSEVNTSGAPSQSTLGNILSIGSNISSIASLAISLYQLFVHP